MPAERAVASKFVQSWVSTGCWTQTGKSSTFSIEKAERQLRESDCKAGKTAGFIGCIPDGQMVMGWVLRMTSQLQRYTMPSLSSISGSEKSHTVQDLLSSGWNHFLLDTEKDSKEEGLFFSTV